MIETGVRPAYQGSPRRFSDSVLVALTAIAQHALSLRPNPYVLILMTAVILEALLAGRLWAQLTSQTDAGMTSGLMDITSYIVAPFRSFDVSPTRDTGIFEFATVAAMEAILVAALTSIIIIFVGGKLIRAGSYLFSRIERPTSPVSNHETELHAATHPDSVTPR